jgi:hypothetical protein
LPLSLFKGSSTPGSLNALAKVLTDSSTSPVSNSIKPLTSIKQGLVSISKLLASASLMLYSAELKFPFEYTIIAFNICASSFLGSRVNAFYKLWIASFISPFINLALALSM